MAEEQETKKAEETPKPEQDGAVKTEEPEKPAEEPPKEMRAVVLTGFGGLKSVKVLKKPEPTVAEGEVLIRVKACGLNFQDLMVRQGVIDSLPKTPFILGFECAGEVEAVGEGVEKFKVGDRVVALPEYRAWAELVAVPQQYVFPLPAELSFLDVAALTTNYIVLSVQVGDRVVALPEYRVWAELVAVPQQYVFPLPTELSFLGVAALTTNYIVLSVQVGDRVVALPEYRAWAELVAVPQQYVFPLPAELSFLDAAALTMNYIVAHILLFELGGLAPGKSVLVHSAGGGVGQAVAQLCKTVKDTVVFGVASKSKHEAIKDSVDHLLERGTDYTAELKKISPDGVDIVLDCLCGEECNRGYSLLKPMGKYVLYGSANVVTGETKSIFSAARSWWQVDKVSPIKLFDENKSLSGLNLRHLMYQQNRAPYVAGVFDTVVQLWSSGKIKPVVDSTWALEDVPEAMQKMHDRKNVGKIVLDPSMEPKPKPATPAKGKAKSIDKDDKKKSEDESNDSPPPSADGKDKEEEKKASS